MFVLLENILCYLLLTAVTLLAVTLVSFKFFPKLAKLVFSIFYPMLSKSFSEDVIKEKTELFSLFKSHKSKRGFTRILELGTGPGNNFQFYPENTRLTLLEPNTYFVDMINKKLKRKFPKTKLERMVIGHGEDMSAIESGSMDFVVVTYVLCSVRNITLVLQEIHRVLTPGGKYVFLEHGYGRRKWTTWAVQHTVNPVWKVLCDGCEVVKNTIDDINGCGLFVNVHHKWFPPPVHAPLYLKLALGNCFYGTAQKKEK